MKLQKRFAAVILCAVMALAALTACSGGPAPTKLEWANSRTKQYFDAKGVTPQEFTLTADITVSGQKAGLKFAVKDKWAGYEFDITNGQKWRVDDDGNVYREVSNSSYREWWKYPAGSPTADSYAHSIRTCWGYFTLPTDQNVGSISAGKYKKDDKTYDTETIKVHQENVYATYTYCYDGNELSFILVEPIVGMENIDLKPTADEAVIAIPPVDRVIND
jgi:hypothetical protein